MLTSLLFSLASAAEPDAELLARAQQLKSLGVAEIGLGAGLAGGGLALMIVGREGGQLSGEAPAVHELRTMGGIGLLLAGITSAMAGGNALERAAAAREEATLSILPEPVAQGAGIRLQARF